MGVSGVAVGGVAGALVDVVAEGTVVVLADVVVTGAAARGPDEHAASARTMATAAYLTAPSFQHYLAGCARPDPDVRLAHQPAARRGARRALRRAGGRLRQRFPDVAARRRPGRRRGGVAAP